MVCDMKDEGVALLHKVPSFKNIKTGLCNERNKVIGAPKLRYHPSECCEVVVPKTFNNFLLADYQDPNDDKTRILVFCNEEVGNNLGNYNNVLADGTFRSCPSSFKQL